MASHPHNPSQSEKTNWALVSQLHSLQSSQSMIIGFDERFVALFFLQCFLYVVCAVVVVSLKIVICNRFLSYGFKTNDQNLFFSIVFVSFCFSSTISIVIRELVSYVVCERLWCNFIDHKDVAMYIRCDYLSIFFFLCLRN